MNEIEKYLWGKMKRVTNGAMDSAKEYVRNYDDFKACYEMAKACGLLGKNAEKEFGDVIRWYSVIADSQGCFINE